MGLKNQYEIRNAGPGCAKTREEAVVHRKTAAKHPKKCKIEGKR